MDDGNLKIIPPLYPAGIKIDCWRCRARMPVVTIVATNIENEGSDVAILTGIVALPNEVLNFVQERVPTFKIKYSQDG